MKTYARLARDAGARIVGCCCGSTPEHIAALVEALAGYTPGPCPDLPAIEEALGLQRVAPKPGGPRKRNSRRGN